MSYSRHRIYTFLATSPLIGNNRSFHQRAKLDPVSRVTGIPGWYWILGIKCSDTIGVGLVYWNSELKSGQGHTPISKHRHAMHPRVIFCRVGGLLEITFFQKERRVLTRKRTKMSNYFTHGYFVVDYVCCANKCHKK